MKYLDIYANQDAYNAGKLEATFGLPHVSLIENTMAVVYDPYVAPVEGQNQGK